MGADQAEVKRLKMLLSKFDFVLQQLDTDHLQLSGLDTPVTKAL